MEMPHTIAASRRSAAVLCSAVVSSLLPQRRKGRTRLRTGNHLFGCFLALCSLLVASSVAVPAPAPVPDSAGPTAYIIGISPFLDDAVKDDVYRSLVRLLVQGLPLNSTLAVYDAFDLKSITQVTIPNARAFESPKTRANQFASAIRDLKRFLAEPHARPTAPGLKFQGALRLPQFCDFLAASLAGTNTPASLLLLGSPLYQDNKEPGFSMVDGYFPSDAHLVATRDKSVFGLPPDPPSAGAQLVTWVYFADPWTSDLYQEKITRFWTLYLERRGGQLQSLCGDLPTGIRDFEQGPAGGHPAVHHWSLDPAQTKIEMLRIGREVQLADWIERDSILQSPSAPPSALLGPMKIGIRWKENIDLDLYATAHPGAETLFFQHPRSLEGYYYKDHRSSPGKDYEFIEFDTPVDAREVEAFINFYKGACPPGPHGEVRIEFDGRIYSAPFSIEAPRGNRGRTGSAQQEFWTRIPVQRILKLTQAAPAIEN